MSEITITISCATPAEARDVLAALAGPTPAETTDAAYDLIGALVAAPVTTPVTKPEAPTPKPEAPVPKPEPAGLPSLDEAIDALREFGRERGAVALKGVLDQLGVRRATEIQPDQISNLIAAMNGAAG